MKRSLIQMCSNFARRWDDYVASLCLLPNNILVCGLSDSKITKLNLNDFTKINSFKAHQYSISNLKHVSSSQIVSCSMDKNIQLWDLEGNRCVRTFIGYTSFVNCLEISFDKTNIYSGGLDETLRHFFGRMSEKHRFRICYYLH